MMNASRFWEIIDGIGWAKLSVAKKDIDFGAVCDNAMRVMAKDENIAFRERLGRCVKRLTRAINEYEEQADHKHLPYSGDDSFNDMVTHAIGLGEVYFVRAVTDPSLLAKLKVRESFVYCIPFVDNYDKELQDKSRADTEAMMKFVDKKVRARLTDFVDSKINISAADKKRVVKAMMDNYWDLMNVLDVNAALMDEYTKK